jgi:hypothetical protein
MVNASAAGVIPGDIERYWLEPLKLKLPARGVYKSTGGGGGAPILHPGPILHPAPIFIPNGGAMLYSFVYIKR